MTGSGKTRAAFAAAASVVCAATLAALVHGTGADRPRTALTFAEPATVAATAAAGGVVAEILARPGDRVAKGRVLLRFETGALAEQRRALASALESSRSMAAIPRAAIGIVVDSHPDVFAAEERYTTALAAWEQAPERGRAALDRAASERIEARRRVARSLGKSTEGMASTVAMLEARLRDLDRSLEDREVRAPADGIVEILDLRPGDRIAPGGPAAVLTIPGEYVCEFPSELPPGAILHGRLAGGARVEARVEGVVARTTPLALREDRRVAQEVFARVRFRHAAPLPPGTAVRLELP